MKTEDFNKLITPIATNLEKDKDPYLMVHFSREENEYKGFHEGLDKFDAIIIMKELATFFKMDKFELETLITISTDA